MNGNSGRWQGTKDEDKPALVGKIVEGLRDDALTVAMDIGYQELASEQGVAKLVEKFARASFLTAKKKLRNCTIWGIKTRVS